MMLKKEKTPYRREAAHIMVWCLLAVVVLAVISFNPADPTLFHFSTQASTITNWCGLLGAQLAGLLFYLFGSACYALLLLVVLPIYRLLIKEKQRRPLPTAGRVLALVLTVATLGGLYHLDLHAIPAGGLVGGLLAQGAQWLLGGTGSLLLSWSLVWVQLVILLQVPLMPLVLRAARILQQHMMRMLGACAVRMRAIFSWRPAVKQQEATDDFADVLLAAGATKVAAFEEEQGGEQPPSPALESKLAQVPVHREPSPTQFLKATFNRLPNTRLHVNPFAADEHGAVPYEKVLDVYHAEKRKAFLLPDASFFAKPAPDAHEAEDAEVTAKRAEKIKEKLRHFGVNGTVVGVKPGPVVTLYEYKPDINSKISKIVGLEDDLAMALTAQSMRIIAPIPGKNAVGFEIANAHRQHVLIAQILGASDYVDSRAALPLVLGVDAMGQCVVEDLATTPHLLVGGATGAGKSVGLNVMLLSLLCKRTPDELKLILIDPKRLEFTPYADLPHLLFPIVTQPTRASAVLAWVVQEMERRYAAMAALGVRSVQEYRKAGHEIPFLVVIIDELADLMMVAGKEVEMHIVRIAQMARAAGIHLIVATQRPSVDVMTGLIKANFPSRVAFRVSSKIDSRTILDSQGAEKLLGRGDMLYMHGSSPDLRRVHCPYVSDKEVESVASFLRAQRKPQYIVFDEASVRGALQQEQYDDDLYGQVCDFVRGLDEISISMLQRQYRIGFNRSARLIEKLETDGIIAPAQGSKPRKVIR